MTVPRVVFFGDSRAEWWLAPTSPEFEWVHAGVPGASATYLARRFRVMVAHLRPAVVVVQMGVNDLAMLADGGPGQQQLRDAVYNATAAAVTGARALGARVVLSTIFPLARVVWEDRIVQDAITAINARLPGLAADDVQLLDTATLLTGPDGYVRPEYAVDEAHLSAAGYAALNDALVRILRAMV